ncbi:LxmA leader domain family RiPP [Amycolatopsis sp. NPDC059027]|uniref:LxmA leader domain family RiPP n=1 Tax=unclassified Amycolatopsis TaxID=2618356 RepID=UPI0036713491
METRELMNGFGAYTDAAELQVSAATEAPASTPWCLGLIIAGTGLVVSGDSKH